MNHLLMVIVSLFAAVVESLAPTLNILGQGEAPIVLGVVIYYALTRERHMVVKSAIVAGIFYDALCYKVPPGFSAIAYVCIGLLVNQYRDKIFGNHWITHMFLGAVASLIMTVMMYTMLISRGNEITISGMLIKALGVMLMSLGVIPLVFKFVERLDYKLGNVELREI
jgi:rod shape-determining protein MreD